MCCNDNGLIVTLITNDCDVLQSLPMTSAKRAQKHASPTTISGPRHVTSATKNIGISEDLANVVDVMVAQVQQLSLP